MVWDHEDGGSNPLTPTFSYLAPAAFQGAGPEDDVSEFPQLPSVANSTPG